MLNKVCLAIGLSACSFVAFACEFHQQAMPGWGGFSRHIPPVHFEPPKPPAQKKALTQKKMPVQKGSGQKIPTRAEYRKALAKKAAAGKKTSVSGALTQPNPKLSAAQK